MDKKMKFAKTAPEVTNITPDSSGEILNKIQAMQAEIEQLKNKNSQLTHQVEELLCTQEELNNQKFKLADANVRMLQTKEELDAKTYKLVEANLHMLELKEALEEEKQRSEKLLRNILPDRVIADLNEFGESKPEFFPNVTVFFSDIVNFTAISSKMPPPEVINELNEIFTEFDHIFKRNHCERIKTIGDAYLSICGMPTPNEEHWKNILLAALEIKQFLRARQQNGKSKLFAMRIGVHSGEAVGGIVGVEKYIYDVFGDAINTAARMETSSEPMEINVSESTYNLAHDYFEFQSRGCYPVKGKGEMEMFFLQRPKQN